MNPIKQLFNWYFTKKALPYWCILVIDCAIVAFSAHVVYYFQVGGSSFAGTFWKFNFILIFYLAFFLLGFRLFHTYRGIIRFSTFADLGSLFDAALFGTVVAFAMSRVLPFIGITSIPHLSISGAVLLLGCVTALTWAVRICVRTAYEIFRSTDTTRRAFIYGIHEGGVSNAKNIADQSPKKYEVAGFVSPEEDLGSKYLMGVLVRHDSPRLIKHMKDKGANILFVSPMQTEHFRERQDLINSLIENNIQIMMMPHEESWDGKSELTTSNLHEVEVEDLLPREKIEVNMDAIGAQLTGKRILITGAAGSIGSEMVRQVAKYNPAEMILIDQAETPMHDIRMMMSRKFPGINALTIVATITDKEYMEHIFANHRPDYVFHAAAYKHVPMMEDNPAEAVKNNICGTRIIADLAVKYGTRKFVMISTDKAVNPTNVMGCSKRICEIYCQSLNKAIEDGKVAGVTQFVTTRFGNVLGSNGSVIPIFKEQIKHGGPVTVTDPNIIRFFMLIPEACKLVLEAGTMGKGGEIFVFDMGKPVKIVDLAKRMIALSGAQNVEIKFTGLRDGEKLYEEVLNDAEKTVPTDHPKIKVAKVREYPYNEACANEEALLKLADTFDSMAIVAKMKEIVPEYRSVESVYCQLDK